jgi:hypothetical protein
VFVDKFGVVYEFPVPSVVVRFELEYQVIVPVPDADIFAVEPQLIEGLLVVGAEIGLTVIVYGDGCDVHPLEYVYVKVK